MEDTPPEQQHVCRIGISRGDDEVGKLGESLHSFGFGGTGKFSANGKFSDYGEKFGAGDTIVCSVDLESKPLASISFSKNGKWLGIATQFDACLSDLQVVSSSVRERQRDVSLFPHVLLKNVVVELQFSVEEGLAPQEGYRPWALALDDGNAIIGPSFSNISDCEVMMMVGLPASGKSTWAEKWVKEHPEKRYILLGTNLVLDQMKVPGLLRKKNYGERFDLLIGRANAIFDTLLSKAARTPRNYVIDQTNVFKGARKRKLSPFAKFHKIAVVVFPRPDELKFRADRQLKEMGKEVPVDVLNNMLANYVLPTSKDMPASDEFFDEVIFVELNQEESKRCLEEMKRALKANYTPYSRERSISSCTPPSIQNEGVALSVSGGDWQTSQPPLPPMSSEYQITNQVGRPFSFTVCQSFQNSSVPMAPVRTSTSNYSGNYSNVPVFRPVSNHSYGAIGPYNRPNTDVRNAAFGASAASNPYGDHIVEFPPVGTGGSHPILQTPRTPTYLPPPAPFTYDPRPPWSMNPFYIQPHPGRGDENATPASRMPSGNFPPAPGAHQLERYPTRPRYY